jgi:asparagine synthase (glutamine-hydrolysing)
MCGIFGAIGDANASVLEAGRRALHHRGPDSDGVWLDGDSGLAHTRLKVIDLSELAAQPMHGDDPRVRVTFNGEIYNHRALRAELERAGQRFRTAGSDTEVIVRGYAVWGEQVIERLDGMFALGIWDAPRKKLVLARDRAGKKPIYYAVSPDARTLRFASEVKALVAAGHPDALDEQALPMLLAWGYVPAPASLHQGVEQLPAASRLVFEPGRPPRIDRYWQPGFREPMLDVSFDEAKRRVRELVVAAVERRLESDVPLGAFLSGGLDSTIVVGVMSRLLGKKVRSFSIGFAGDARFDETHFARMAAQAFDTHHTELTVEPASIEAIEKLVWLHDGPFGDSSALPTHALSRLTREHVTVALAGDGGDELFAGYLRFLAAEAADRVPRPLRSTLARLGALLPGGLPHHSLGARARRFLVAAPDDLAERSARWNSIFAADLDALVAPGVRARVDMKQPMRWMREHLEHPGSLLHRLLDHNFNTYLAFDLLPKVDRCSAGCALEVRSPFLDTALIDYCSRLPDHFLRRGTQTKRILRAAFSDLVPAPIMKRGKMGFGVPLATWFREGLRDYVHDTLARGAHLYAYVDERTVAGLLDAHTRKRADHSARIWTLLTLEIWLRGLSAVTQEAHAARVHG